MQLNNEDERFRKYYNMRSKGVSHNVALEQSKYKTRKIIVVTIPAEEFYNETDFFK